MQMQIRPVEYFYTTVLEAGEDACSWLSTAAEAGVNLLAFSAAPVGPSQTQLTVFPEQPDLLRVAAERSGLTLTGPNRAFLVQGDDKLGAIAEIHHKLCQARSGGVCGQRDHRRPRDGSATCSMWPSTTSRRRRVRWDWRAEGA